MISTELIKRFQQISYFFNQRAYAQVISLFSPSLSIDKVPVEITLMYAVALRHTGMPNKSKSTFVSAIALFPDNAALRNSYGNLLLELNLPILAVEQFDHAIKLAPNKSDSYLNGARAMTKLGHNEKAVRYARSAYELAPANSNIAVALAENLCRVNGEAEALLLYKQILEQFPDNIKALNNLGNLRRRRGEIPEAIELLERAAATNNPVVLRNLAACLVLNNEFAKACRYFQQAILAAPDDVNAYTELGALLWQQGEAEPFEHIEKRLNVNPANYSLRCEYIKILLQLEQPAKAESYLLTLLQRLSADSDILTLAIMVYRDLGDLEKAEQFGYKALASVKDESDISARSELAYTLLAQHKGDKARVIYKQLCVDDPNNQGWWTTYSTALKQCSAESEYAWLCNYQLINVSDLSNMLSPVSLSRNFNQQLLPLLEKLHCNSREPLGLSLKKGSQTFENLFDRNDELLQQLRLVVIQQAQRFINSLQHDAAHPFLSRLTTDLDFQGSWSVQLRDEGFHKSHFHPMGWLSGVYYVDVPAEVERDGQGWLVFGRPDIPNNEYQGDYAVKPDAGLLVLFPSFMWHGTNPFKSSSKRVTVAFDLIPSQHIESKS